MSTTIRVAKKDKEKLDQLPRYLSFTTNRKITQEEVMESLIDSGERNKEELSQKFVESQENEEPIDESDPFFQVPEFHIGKNASREHDKIIYGDER
jgi:hypothetical protein